MINYINDYDINNHIESPIQSHIYDHSDIKRLCEEATKMGIAVGVEQLHVMHISGVTAKSEKWIPDTLPKWAPCHKYSLIVLGSEFEFYKDANNKPSIRRSEPVEERPGISDPYTRGLPPDDDDMTVARFLDVKITGAKEGKPYRL